MFSKKIPRLRSGQAKKKNKLAFSIMFFGFGFLFLLLSVLILGFSYLFIQFNQIKTGLDQLPDKSGELKVKEKVVEPPVLNEEEFRLPAIISPSGLNLVFYADQYPSWDSFEKDVELLMAEVEKVKPWRDYFNYNIYKIRPNNAQSICEVKTQDERKPVLRCGDEINNYLNQLPLERFKLVVLSKQNFQSWANVVRLQNSGIFFSVPTEARSDHEAYGILFLHLLGHAFGLKDEETIVLAKHDASVLTPDGPNCAPDLETAKNWWSDLAKQYPDRVGYFEGCSGDPSYIRPTKSSLMNLNDLSNFISEYGLVSERYLNNVLQYCFTAGDHQESEDPQFFSLYPEFKECL